MLSRRNLMRTAGSLAISAAALGALAACANAPTAADIAGKTKIVADAIVAFVADIQAFGIHISDNVVAQLNKLAIDVEMNAQAIATALQPGTVYQEIVNGARAIGALLAPYYPPAPKLEAAFEATLQLVLDTAAQLGFKVV